jgi:hypothetical protein
MKIQWSGYGLFALMCAGNLGLTQAAPAEVNIEVLNPRGEIEPQRMYGISPRLPDPAGKAIGLYDNGKGGFSHFLDVVEGLLRQRYPTITVKRYNGAFDLGDPLARTVAAEVDAVIYGSGD